MIISCLSTIVMMLLLRSAPNNAVALSGLLFATGLFLSLGFSLFSIYSAALCDRSTFPVATAVMNTCGQFGGATMPLFTGILLDAYDWDAVFIGLACAAALAFVFLVSIVEPRGFKEDLANSQQ